MAIEELVTMFSGLPPATGGRWNISPLVANRIFLSRDEGSRFAIFIVGDEGSFGTYPKISGLQHASGIIPVPGGAPFAALRLISASLAHGNRVMAHVAYEMERRLAHDPKLNNAQLLSEVAWILELLADQEALMSDELQKGLVGELALLRRLLGLAKELNLPSSEVLARWWGYDHAKRDFAARGVAIEVKTTSKPTRSHYVGSLTQLDPQGIEDVYVYSLGARLDPTAPRKLPAFIADVDGLLTRSDGSPDEAAKKQFAAALKAYGYNPTREKLYSAGPGFLGFHLPPKLFKEPELDRARLSSFKGDKLPGMVSEVMYMLEVRANELNSKDERDVLVKLLQSPAVTG